MIFIPIRTDTPLRRLPVVNYLLIVLNVSIFLALDVFAPRTIDGGLSDFKRRYMLDPENLTVAQFFSYQFLHGDILHLLGNMLFLWVFGNSVNAKMGHAAYLFFYLACGVFAGVAFATGDTNPCLGASGSIAGITTAFLVLFPRSSITVFYWFIWFVGAAQFQAMLLIVLKIILWDNILAPRLSPGIDYVSVAYSAHIAGYIFGFVWCAFMLLVRALPRDQYDIVALAKRYYQRQQYRAMMADPETRAQMTYGRVARPVSAVTGEVIEEPESRPVSVIVDLRGEIADLIDLRDYEGAAAKYAELLSKDAEQILPRKQLLDVANHLMRTNRHAEAAAAYEKFVKHYSNDAEIEQVQLVLGIIYARYLGQYDRAQQCLRDSLTRLSNPDLVQQANNLLETVTAALGPRPDPVV
ncbi:MAG: hypothetical protein DCC65_04005 [Planctomycetota bacterium]|nr:MAG: hypothetical protein DCC65_04005 [Planctomycetota bacterium]